MYLKNSDKQFKDFLTAIRAQKGEPIGMFFNNKDAQGRKYISFVAYDIKQAKVINKILSLIYKTEVVIPEKI